MLDEAKVTEVWTEDDAAAWWNSVMGVALATTAAFPTQSDRPRHEHDSDQVRAVL